jgi:hypothetical protein
LRQFTGGSTLFPITISGKSASRGKASVTDIKMDKGCETYGMVADFSAKVVEKSATIP